MNRHHGAPGPLGYPTKAPGYQPPRRQDDHSSDRPHYTDEDVDLAEQIGKAVQMCEDPERVALVEFHGAYPGAPIERRQRLARLRRNLNRSTSGCEMLVRNAERYVAGILRGWGACDT